MVAGHTSMATRGATISLDCSLVPAPCPAPAPDTPEILSAIMTISSPHLTSLKTEAAPPPAPAPAADLRPLPRPVREGGAQDEGAPEAAGGGRGRNRLRGGGLGREDGRSE